MIRVNLIRANYTGPDFWPGGRSTNQCTHRHLGVLRRNVNGKCALCASERTAKFRKRNPDYQKDWLDKHPTYSQDWARKNRDKRAQSRRKRAGVQNPEVFDTLLQLQGGMCAICYTSDFGKTGPCLDHFHGANKAGPARGILCRACNSGLGHLNDSEQLLFAAIEYLKNPPAGRLLK